VGQLATAAGMATHGLGRGGGREGGRRGGRLSAGVTRFGLECRLRALGPPVREGGGGPKIVAVAARHNQGGGCEWKQSGIFIRADAGGEARSRIWRVGGR